MICKTCEKEMKYDQLSHCPDNLSSCLVVHFGWICDSCKLEVGSDIQTLKRRIIEILEGDDSKQNSIGFTIEQKIEIT